jgi:O-antigen/teichoic acid export membrane protein
MDVHRRIWVGIQSGAVFIAVSILLSLVQYRLIFKFLPGEMAGIWFVFLNIGVFIAFFDLGISPTLSREIGFVLGLKSGEKAEQDRQIADLVATTVRSFKILSVALSLLTMLLGLLYLNRISSGNLKQIEPAWILFSLGAGLNLFNGGWFSALFGMGHVAAERLIRTIALISGFILSAAFLYFGLGITGLALAWFLQGVFSALVCRKVLFYYSPSLRMGGNASFQTAKKIFHPSVQWTIMSLGGVLTLQTDNIIIAYFLGPAAIPPYAGIAKLATVLMTVSLLIVNSSTPFLSKLYSAGDHEKFNEVMLRNIRFSLALMAVFTSFLGVFGDHLVTLWLGTENFVGFPVLWSFLGMLFLETHHVALATAAMAAGYLVFGWSALIAGVLNIVLSIIFINVFGLWGVALGTLLAQILTNNWYVPYKTLRIFNISIKDYLHLIFFPAIGLAIALLLTNLGVRHLLIHSSSLTILLVSFSVSLISGIILFMFFILNRQEKETLKNYASIGV